MADIRIKDLTTTASSTASGDFFVIDGTTGTRKVNAFNPSFGGSATLTGTLTVNGTGNSSFAGQLIQVADPATIALWKDATPTKAARFQFNTLADNGFSLGVYDGSSWFNAITVAPTTGVVKIPSSSASSSTITGALVVSGGVGVAGNTVVGGASFTTGDGSSGPYLASSSVIDHSSGQARFYGRGANTSTRATLGFYSTYSDGTGGITLQTFDVSGNATFGASIKTSAPSGGTAAAWKLGTVASVSPTSPNRTIEVDIGGTIYYIHAKTTNN